MELSSPNFFYTLFLTLHNLTRWLVVIFAILALVRAFRGWFGSLGWAKGDDRAGMLYTGFLDLQVLFGLILYFFFSPYTAQLFANFGSGMQSASIAFYGVEHEIGMLVAVVVAHVGRALGRKAEFTLVKHRTVAVWFSISILIILISIPWPFLPYGAPWLRLFGITIN